MNSVDLLQYPGTSATIFTELPELDKFLANTAILGFRIWWVLRET
jgi:hypothetical protein